MGVQGGELGNAKCHTADRPRDVRPVSGAIGAIGSCGIAIVVPNVSWIAVPVIIDVVTADECATSEFSVRSADPGIDDVHVHGGSGRTVGIEPIEWSQPLVNAIEAPWRRRLGPHALHRPVFLNVKNTWILREGSRRGSVQSNREALDGMTIDMFQLSSVPGRCFATDGVSVIIRGENDDVLIGYWAPRPANAILARLRGRR